MSKNRYLERGVSSNKEDVHNAIKNTDKGLFSNSFCKVVPDILSNDNSYCNVMHADGAGTKSILAYLYWKETNDVKVWRGIAQDALIMNIDDLISIGITDNIIMSSTILIIFFNIGILEEILAPPRIASTGFFPELITFLIANTSFSSNFPKNLFVKNFDIIVVDA